MNRKLGWMIGAIALTCGASQAALLPYPEPVLKYPAYTNKDQRLKEIWAGFKQQFVKNGEVQGTDPQKNPMVISEGQSYGMLMAVWMNDQATFNTIWNATESGFWNGSSGWYKWKKADANFAGDADFDICGALIFASALVDAGHWTKPSGTNYKDKAIVVLKSLIANFIDKGNNYRINSWPNAGDGIRNPSYHMPQWYPIFKEFAAANNITGMDWDAAAKGAFDLIEAQTNSQYGMARNFSNGSGGSPGGGTSSPNNYDMGFDAIRVPYRMGMAAIWYKKVLPRAANWCNNVWKNGKVNPVKPGMYKVADASLWGWGADGGSWEYEEILSRGMWTTAAIAVKDDNANSAAAFATLGQDFSGKHVGSSSEGYLLGANSDLSDPNHPSKNYFAQALGLMGAIAIYGRAWNVWDDLKNPWTPPDTGASITTALTPTPASIEQTPVGTAATAAGTSKVTAALSKSVNWAVRFTGRTSGAVYSATGTGATVAVDFTSLKKSLGTTKAFGVETVDVRLIYGGVDTATNTKARATITIGKSGIAQRSVRGEGAVRWVDGGLLLQDPAWLAGDRVQVRTLDLGGRTLQTADAVLASAAEGIHLPAKLDASVGVRVLELGNGTVNRRYILSPNP